MRIAMIAVFVLATSGALALEPADRFDRDFNRAAKTANIQHRAGKAGCNAATCDFVLKPSGRLSVVYEGDRKKVGEFAFYFPPEARSGSDVIDVLGAMIELLAKDQPRATREGARLHLIESAAGTARDGEFRLGRWSYVLRPNDGRDVRLYIRSID